MKAFLCGFKDFSLAIPMRYISSLMLYSGQGAFAGANAVEYNEENQNAYVSLPHLFNLPDEAILHGLVLKSLNQETGEPEENNSEDDGVMKNKIILLTTEVKCEAEIPGEEIFPVPKALGGVSPSALFSGIKFESGERTEAAGTPVLFLNVINLVQNIKKRTAA